MSFAFNQPSVAYRTDHLPELYRSYGSYHATKDSIAGYQDGGKVNPQTGGFSFGPKFGLMPVKDRYGLEQPKFAMLSQGAFIPDFGLKANPMQNPSNYFLKHQLNYGKLQYV